MVNRQYPTHPIPGVGAVVASSHGILLARRDKGPGTGLWSIPGGGVELGETQEDAVVREVFEETGVKCKVLELISTADLITPDEQGKIEFHFILNYYLAQAITDVTRPETIDGEVGWFHPDDLPTDIASEEIKRLLQLADSRIRLLMNVDM